MNPKATWGIVASIGAIIFVLGVGLGFGLFPFLISHQVNSNLDLWDMESEGRKNFEVPPVDIFMKFYVNNVENPDEFEAGTAKIKITEKGPYSYREIRRKELVSLESEGRDKIRFAQYKAYVYDNETSCDTCDKDDVITTINAPLVGVIAKIRSDPGLGNLAKVVNLAIETGKYINMTGSFHYSQNDEYIDGLFMDTTVDGLLFNGVMTGVLKFIFEIKNSSLGTVLPYLVQFDNGFAAFNTKNATTKNEFYEMFTGADDDMDDYYSINRWGPTNGSLFDDLTPALWWEENGGYNGSNACNDLKGTDGQQFHPDVKDDETLWIFQTDLCRNLFIKYKEDQDIDGIKVLRFAPPAEALQVNTVTNVGFCMEIEKDVNWDECIMTTSDPNILDLSVCFNSTDYHGSCNDGTLDISRCMETAPVVMSSPHFYQSSDKLREAIDGLTIPDPELHETRIDIEPTTGMAVKLHKRIQVNLPVKKDPDFYCFHDIPDTTLFPLLWVDEGANIDQANIDKLKDMVTTPLMILEGVKWTLIAVGFVIFAIGSIKIFLISSSSR